MAHLAGLGKREKASRRSANRTDLEQLEETLTSHSNFRQKPWQRGKEYFERWQHREGEDIDWPAGLSIFDFPPAKNPKKRNDPLAEYTLRLQYLYHNLLREHTDLQFDTYHRINMFQSLTRKFQRKIEMLEKQVQEMLMARADNRARAMASVDELRNLSNVLDYKVGQLLIPPSKRDRSVRRRGGTAALHVPGLGGYAGNPTGDMNAAAMAAAAAAATTAAQQHPGPPGQSPGLTPPSQPRGRRYSRTPKPKTPVEDTRGQLPRFTMTPTSPQSRAPSTAASATPRTPTTQGGPGQGPVTPSPACNDTDDGQSTGWQTPESAFTTPTADLNPDGTPRVPGTVPTHPSVQTPLTPKDDDRVLFSQLLACRKENARLAQENFYLRNPDAPNAMDFLKWSNAQKDTGHAYDAMAWLEHLKELMDKEGDDDETGRFSELTETEIELNRVRLLLERERSLTLELRAKVFDYLGNESKLKLFLQEAIADVAAERRKAKEKQAKLPPNTTLVADWNDNPEHEQDPKRRNKIRFQQVDVKEFNRSERRRVMDVLLSREHVLNYIYTTFEKKHDPNRDPDGGMSINEAIGRDRTILQRMWDEFPVIYEDIFDSGITGDGVGVGGHAGEGEKRPTKAQALVEQESFVSNLQRSVSAFGEPDSEDRALDRMIRARSRGQSSAFGWGESEVLDRYIKESSQSLLDNAMAQANNIAREAIDEKRRKEREAEEAAGGVRSRAITIDEQDNFQASGLRAFRHMKRSSTSSDLGQLRRVQTSGDLGLYNARKPGSLRRHTGVAQDSQSLPSPVGRRPSTYDEDTDGKFKAENGAVIREKAASPIHRRLSIVTPKDSATDNGAPMSAPPLRQGSSRTRTQSSPVATARAASPTSERSRSPRASSPRSGMPYVQSPLARASEGSSANRPGSPASFPSPHAPAMRPSTPSSLRGSPVSKRVSISSSAPQVKTIPNRRKGKVRRAGKKKVK